jgi:hypothetical protein
MKHFKLFIKYKYHLFFIYNYFFNVYHKNKLKITIEHFSKRKIVHKIVR